MTPQWSRWHRHPGAFPHTLGLCWPREGSGRPTALSAGLTNARNCSIWSSSALLIHAKSRSVLQPPNRVISSIRETHKEGCGPPRSLPRTVHPLPNWLENPLGARGAICCSAIGAPPSHRPCPRKYLPALPYTIPSKDEVMKVMAMNEIQTMQ